MPAPRFLDPATVPLKPQSGRNIWATLVPIIQGGIVAGLVTVVALFFLPVINTEKGYKADVARLQREVAAAEEKQAQLKLETEHMKSDPAYVERIARDRLTMGKPGETILRFDKYQPPTPSAKIPRVAGDDDSN